MAIEQSIDQALARTIGAGGFPEVAIEAGLRLVENALTRLREDDASGRLPLLHMPRASDDLGAIRAAAARLSCEATDVVFLGTGGSSLGGQTLAQLRDYAVPGAGRFAENPRVHFLDNLDPATFERVLQRLPLATTPLRGRVEIGRHRRDPDAGDRRPLGPRPGRPAPARRRAHPRPVRAAEEGRRERQQERAARPPRAGRRAVPGASHRGRRALFRAHQCRPPAGGRARPRDRGRARRRRRCVCPGPRRAAGRGDPGRPRRRRRGRRRPRGQVGRGR